MAGMAVAQPAQYRSGGSIAARGIGMALMLALAGCGESSPFGGGDAGASGDAARTELVSRDVEAPQIFQVTEAGLWDGRPSLGGVWVAYPDVEVEQIGQVVIRNKDNGRFVIGALFRREREAPGPALQASSEAADALGMLAGAPAQLNVTALRRDETASPEALGATTDFDNPEAIAAVPLGPTDGIETAALPATETDTGTDTAAASTPAPAPADAPAPVTAEASELQRPFIQLGIFSVEANARDTATAMEVEGLSARVVAAASQGRDFWRVIVGPAGSEAERASALERIKALGFTDAYFVRN